MQFDTCADRLASHSWPTGPSGVDPLTPNLQTWPPQAPARDLTHPQALDFGGSDGVIGMCECRLA